MRALLLCVLLLALLVGAAGAEYQLPPTGAPVLTVDVGGRIYLRGVLIGEDAALATAPPAGYPNDPKFSEQSELQGLVPVWNAGVTGQPIVIAILDGQVTATNQDLPAYRFVPGVNLTGVVLPKEPPTPHASHMAGIIGAALNNGFGGVGVAPGARLMSVVVTASTNGYGSWIRIAEGLRWAADHGARVACVPFTVTGAAVVEDAARYFHDRGGLVFASSGNDGAALTTPDSPWIVTVGAIGKDGKAEPVSNYGPCVDVSAPCWLTVTTWYDGVYRLNTQTSGACAYAAGVAALVWAAHPTWTAAEVEGAGDGA